MGRAAAVTCACFLSLASMLVTASGFAPIANMGMHTCRRTRGGAVHSVATEEDEPAASLSANATAQPESSSLTFREQFEKFVRAQGGKSGTVFSISPEDEDDDKAAASKRRSPMIIARSRITSMAEGSAARFNNMTLPFNFTERSGNLTTADKARLTELRARASKITRQLLPSWLPAALERVGLDADAKLGTVWARVTAMQQQLDDRERELLAEEADDSRVLRNTDLSLPDRRIWIVTTAALPWMTGTSVNPLLRAAYLARGRPPNSITLMVPFVQIEDQEKLFPPGKRFETAAEQSAFLRQWLEDAGMADEAAALNIVWYPGRYLEVMGSIFPMGDITRLIKDEEADICIMEEPEHINWYRATGNNWSKKFRHVVGIIHTNYVYYAAQDRASWGKCCCLLLCI
jgi:hypothetical protein